MNRTIGTGGLVMMLVVALAAIGIGIALWSKVLTISGIVQTGVVNAAFEQVFTDDDNVVNDPLKDAGDTGDCPIHASPLPGPTSCDPKETGAEGPDDVVRHRYDKDVAQCRAIALPDGQDNEPQPGSQAAFVRLENAYPSYHCTAWFDVVNIGTIPVLLHAVSIQGNPALPCESGASTPYDLNGDGLPDIEICVSDLPTCAAGNAVCEPQIDPGDLFQFNLDIHVMQTAPQDSLLEFNAAMCLHQWNEETGNCGTPNFDRIIDADGIASPLSGDPGAREVLLGQALTSWPTAGGNEGIDAFDNDGNGAWSAGDDIHLEDPAGSCSTAIRDGAHQLGLDCKVLDIDNSLVDGQPVSCDFETGSFCPAGYLTNIKFHDANGNGVYDNGEDIVLDVNNNGIFD